jgi:hypothetical protein
MKIMARYENVESTFNGGICISLLVLMQLHLLRNVTVFFLVFYIFFSFVVILFSKYRRDLFAGGVILFFISGYSLINTLAVYLVHHEYGDPLLGISRFFYSAPVFLLLYAKGFDKEYALRFLLWFGLFAAASLPYQIAFGEIGWFAEPGERAGLIRYSTLLGSLTVFGAVAGPLILLNHYFFENSILFKSLNNILITAGAILSLQKSAVISLIIALMILVKYRLLDLKFLMMIVVGVIGFVVFDQNDFISSLLNFLSNTIGTLETSEKSDDDLLESITVRVFDRPIESIKFFGIENFILGVGYYGAAGGLGYSDLPMMHNMLGELVSIFGILGVVIFMFILRVFFKNYKKYIAGNLWSLKICCFWVALLLFFGSVFSGGLFFQPFATSLFFVSLSLIAQRENV